MADEMTNAEGLEPKNNSEAEKIILDRLAEVKAKMDTMVEPEKYEELKAQHKRLLDDYVNKRVVPLEHKPVYTRKDAHMLDRELGDRVLKGGFSQREFVELSLRRRQAMLDTYDIDPFGQNGRKSEETQEAVDKMQYCLDNSTSDSQFLLVWDQVLKDDPVVLLKVRAAKAEAAKLKK